MEILLYFLGDASQFVAPFDIGRDVLREASCEPRAGAAGGVVILEVDRESPRRLAAVPVRMCPWHGLVVPAVAVGKP